MYMIDCSYLIECDLHCALTGVIEFSEADIVTATNNFDPSSVIGKRGFGEVHRAYFRSSSIAVKVHTKV